MNKIFNSVKTHHKVAIGYDKCTQKFLILLIVCLGVISEKLIFDKVVFVGNKAVTPLIHPVKELEHFHLAIFLELVPNIS